MKETFPYHLYEVVESVKSSIDPNYTHSVVVATVCPRCRTSLKRLEHGEKLECGRCGLRMELRGNGLTCETGEEEEGAK